MVNTAGAARWCGQAIEEWAASGQGVRGANSGVFMQASPIKAMSGTGQKISCCPHDPSGHPPPVQTAARGQHRPGDNPHGTGTRYVPGALGGDRQTPLKRLSRSIRDQFSNAAVMTAAIPRAVSAASVLFVVQRSARTISAF